MNEILQEYQNNVWKKASCDALICIFLLLFICAFPLLWCIGYHQRLFNKTLCECLFQPSVFPVINSDVQSGSSCFGSTIVIRCSRERRVSQQPNKRSYCCIKEPAGDQQCSIFFEQRDGLGWSVVL